MKRLPLLLTVLTAGLVSAAGQITIRGEADFRIRGTRVRLEADALRNDYTNKTGLLRFRLWASEDPWRHNELAPPPHGDLHSLAISTIPALQPLQRRFDIHRTVHFSDPEPGWWYVTLTLEERYYDEFHKKRWRIVDAFLFGQGFFSGQ